MDDCPGWQSASDWPRYNDMCCINNSISCLEKKTTYRNTWSDMLCQLQCLSKMNCAFVPSPMSVSLEFKRPELMGWLSVALVISKTSYVTATCWRPCNRELLTKLLQNGEFNTNHKIMWSYQDFWVFLVLFDNLI